MERTSSGNARLIEHLVGRIRSTGPLSFRDYMAEVLYHPVLGYYASPRDPMGPQGDFYTSSDMDPAFGRLLARQLEEMAEDLDGFTVVEIGAGRGLLARHILDSHRFRYRILETSPAMRLRQQQALKGYAVDWIDALPGGLVGCIFSNEFFDALPVRRYVCRQGRLREIYVTADFEQVEDEPQVAIELPLSEGQVADVNLDAREWIRRIGASLDRGYHLVVDYGYLRREFYSWPKGTLMCYWRHQATEDPYVRIGQQDMTAHVNFSDLIAAGSASGLDLCGFTDQMSLLINLGLLDEIEALSQKTDRGSIRRLLILKNLIHPAMMGKRFKVLAQGKGPVSRVLAGFRT